LKRGVTLNSAVCDGAENVSPPWYSTRGDGPEGGSEFFEFFANFFRTKPGNFVTID